MFPEQAIAREYRRSMREKASSVNECGKEWENLPQSCYACNPNGAHYHYSNGSCDTEPCVRHGGPQ